MYEYVVALIPPNKAFELDTEALMQAVNGWSGQGWKLHQITPIVRTSGSMTYTMSSVGAIVVMEREKK